jgi:DNA-binding transcriptional ArsR family regulator
MRRKPEEIRRAATVFKALSHPKRLEIACILIDQGELTQKQLIEEMKLPQSTVSRYLEPLKQVGLVKAQRNAQEVRFSLTGEILNQMLDQMCDWFHNKEV